MVSPFQQRKGALAFYRWDRDKDGVVRADDIAQWGQGAAAHLNLAQGSPEYTQITDAYHRIWEFWLKPFDTDQDDALTLDDFLAQLVAFQDPQAYAQGIQANQELFDLLDRDADGRIGPDEYAAFVQPIGVSDEETQTAFSQLDRDGDGFIERDEFAADLLGYFQSDDRAERGNWFFGAY
jgi:Ca2+-binding EF-hand superfamily protein